MEYGSEINLCMFKYVKKMIQISLPKTLVASTSCRQHELNRDKRVGCSVPFSTGHVVVAELFEGVPTTAPERRFLPLIHLRLLSDP